jgi:hypothetical protein
MNAHVTPFNAESKNRRAAALFNKPHHPTTRSRSVYMIFRNYNLNPVIHVRPRS